MKNPLLDFWKKTADW